MLTDPAVLTVNVRATEGHDVVELAGELDLATTPLVYEHVRRLVADGRTRLVVDLDEVTFLDATGLGFLVDAHREIAASGGSLVVRYEHVAVPELLRLSGLTRILAVG